MDWQKILAAGVEPDTANVGIRSPAAEWLTLPRLDSYGDNWVKAHWDIDPRSLNSRGTIFGGYYGVLADGLLALATMTQLHDDEHFVTNDLRLSFFRTASEGRVSMRADVTNRSRTLMHVEGEFRDESGALLAKAVAVQSIKPMAASSGGA